MKREIKFRGKSIEGFAEKDNNWVFGDYRHPIDNYENYQHTITSRKDDFDDKGFSFQIDPETLGQFTGLFDINGVPIYEDDILFFDRGTAKYYRYIIFRNGCFLMRDEVVNCAVPMKDADIGRWEIVGNIHDNPELVKIN